MNINKQYKIRDVKDIVFISEIYNINNSTKAFDIGLISGHTLNIKFSLWDYVDTAAYWQSPKEEREKQEKYRDEDINSSYNNLIDIWENKKV